MIGIYKITSPSGKCYIGQSVNIEKRLTRYKNMNVKTENQTKIWRSLKKYGAENHKYDILKECDITELNEWERYYQEKYDSVENGYNCFYTKTNDKSGKASKVTLKRMSDCQKGNKHWLGKKHTQETKDKISKANKGRRFTDEQNKKKGRKGIIPPLKGKFGKNNPLSKKVNQYTLKGEFIKTWDSGADIKRTLGLNSTGISLCCNNILKTSHGYIWKFNT